MKINTSRSSNVFDEFLKNYSRYRDNVDSGVSTRISKIAGSSRMIKVAALLSGAADILAGGSRGAVEIGEVSARNLADLVAGAQRLPIADLSRVLNSGDSLGDVLLTVRSRTVEQLSSGEMSAQLIGIRNMISDFEVRAINAVKESPEMIELRRAAGVALPGENAWIASLEDAIANAYAYKTLENAGTGKNATQIMDEAITEVLRNGARNIPIEVGPEVSNWARVNRTTPALVDELDGIIRGTRSGPDAEQALQDAVYSQSRAAMTGSRRSQEGAETDALVRQIEGPDARSQRAQRTRARKQQEAEGTTEPQAARRPTDQPTDIDPNTPVPPRVETPEDLSRLEEAVNRNAEDIEAINRFRDTMNGQVGQSMNLEQVMALFQDMSRTQQETIREMAQAMGSQRVTVKQINQQSVDNGVVAGGRRTAGRTRQAQRTSDDSLRRKRGQLRRTNDAGERTRLQEDITRLEETSRRSSEATQNIRRAAGWRALIPGMGAAKVAGGLVAGALVIGGGYLLWQFINSLSPEEKEFLAQENATINPEMIEPGARRLANATQNAITALRAVQYTPGSTGDAETGEYIAFLESTLLPAAEELAADGNQINDNGFQYVEMISGEANAKSEYQHIAMQPGRSHEADVVAGDEADFITAETAVEELRSAINEFSIEVQREFIRGLDAQDRDNLMENRRNRDYPRAGGGANIAGQPGGRRSGRDAGIEGRRDDEGPRRNEIRIAMDLWGETWNVILPARSRRVGGQRVRVLRSDIAEKLGSPPPDGTRPGPIYRALSTDIGREYVGLNEANEPETGLGHSDWSNITQAEGGMRFTDAVGARISLAIQRMSRYNIDSVRELRRDLIEDSRDQLGQGVFNTSPAFREERRSLRGPTRQSRRQERRDRRRRRRESRRRADLNLEHLHKISNKKSLDKTTNIHDLIETKKGIKSNMSFNKKADQHSNEYFRGAVKGLNDSSAKTYYAGFKDMYNERPERRPKDTNSLYMTGDETGSELVQRAHPKSIVVSDAMGRGGLVENLLEQHRHGEEVAFSTPTGNYRSKHAFVLDELKGLAKKARSENNAEAFEMIKSAMVEIVSLTQS